MKREDVKDAPLTIPTPSLLGNQPLQFTDTPRSWAQVNPDGTVFVDWGAVEAMAKKMSMTPMAQWTLPEAHAYILWQVRQEGLKQSIEGKTG